MDLLTSLRQSLGLAEDADEATILKAHTDALTELEKLNEAKPEVKLVDVPAPLAPGVVSIDESALKELQVAASRGQEAFATLQRQERDRVLGEAVKAGKFAPARFEAWQKAYDADPDGTRATLDTLEAGLIPVAASGYTGGEQETQPVDDAWFPQFSTTGQEA